MATHPRREFTGPALFSYGFRPFFLAAGVFALVAVAGWTWFLHTGDWSGAYPPHAWHAHEMLFGYVSAAIAGFLYTSIPNWTGRLPIRGWPLALMVALWLAGRLAMATPESLGAPLSTIAMVDAAFLFVLAAVAGREIFAGKNYRNIKILAPVLLLASANVAFHLETLRDGAADGPQRAALAAILLLIALIGGRITPSFTRNWLTRQAPGAMPTPFGRLDAAAMIVLAAALVAWTIAPDSQAAGILLAAAAAGQALRLGRWAGARTTGNVLLFVLHGFFACLPLGLAALAAAALTGDDAFRLAGLHILGVGLIGGMTLSVMARATLGHTGRALLSTPALTACFACIALAAIARALAAFLPDAIWMFSSAALWLAAFAFFLTAAAPWLLKPRAPRA